LATAIRIKRALAFLQHLKQNRRTPSKPAEEPRSAMTRLSPFSRFLLTLAAAFVAIAGLAPTRSIGADPPGMEAVGGDQQYIIVFREAPAAEYRGGVPGLPAIQTVPGRSRLDMQSAAARAYVEYVSARQGEAETRISQAIGRTLSVTMRTQHALNAIVASLTPAEAEAVRRLPEVQLLDPVRHVPMDTDTGPARMGAPAIWAGTAPGNPVAAQGEGMVIGVLDSGINFGSPSFAATDPVDGYVHVNPLGSGVFLGTCTGGGVDVGRCNNKLIGGYDFVCLAPGNQCGQPNVREEQGFGDSNGHGSHTASTAAGNRRSVVVSGNNRSIQGVAPRANLIAYDVCYTNTATGQGLCPNVSSVAAVNQAIADGIVDAINFSIGGGTAPWGDAVSLAFLSATNAGIYVATSAGNSGPGANTMGHHEPWTASTAAAQHGRGAFRYFINVTGPGTVPSNLASIPTNEGTGGVALGAAIPGITPLIASPDFTAPAGDGCVAYPAGTFTGAIALVSRGVCSFAIKVNNAATAGAIAVVIANNAAGEIAPSVPGTAIPVFGILQADGAAMRTFALANPGATAGVPFPATIATNTPDALASFSSRGPAANLDLLKPDVTAPGVDVLAAYAGTTISGFENLTGVISGTSMASPHNAGSALLLKQLKPTWSPMEVKSALEMTTARTVLKEDGVTPATPHDMGGGRIRVDRAANAGLVLNEFMPNFQAANPAAGGNPTTLNLPSYAKNNCVGSCSFTRILRSPLGTNKTWTATVTGLTGTVSPSTFTVAAGGAQTITVTINTSAIPADGLFRYGWVELAPQGGTPDDLLTMPVAVSVGPPVIALTPATQNVVALAGQTTVANYTVGNVGGAALVYTAGGAGQGATTVADTNNLGVGSGFRGTSYTDPGPGTGNLNAQLQADDFTVAMPTTITSLYAEGFVVSNLALTAVATNITWAIYPDNGSGLPSGNPIQGTGTPAWTYTAGPASAGVSTTNNFITLNLAAAGQNVTLAPGRYWLVVYTRSTFANRWAWYGTNGSTGGFAGINITTTNTGAWAANTAFSGLAMKVIGTVPCNAPWIGATAPGSATVPGGATVPTSTTLNATGLAPGLHVGAVCFASNDPVTPTAAEMFRLTVSAAPAGTAAKLAFTTAPSSTANTGVAFPQQPVVTVQDAANATVTGYVTPVTLSVATGPGTLQCDANPVIPVNGVATFSGCRINGAGTVTLRASSGTIPDSTTNPSITVAGAVAQLAFTTQPGNGIIGSAFSTQPVVAVQDAGGNTVTTSTAAITLAISMSTGSTLTCTTNPLAASAGVATFAGCRIDKAGTYTLTASSPGIPIAVSGSFTVSAKTDQAITFAPLVGKLVTDPDFAIAATASSGLAVAFASDTAAVCTVAGSTVHLVAAGTCTIRASQAGNSTYNPAPDVTQSFQVSSSTRLVNMSTRLRVQTGDGVMIAGLVVGGSANKTVAIVATGPSLSAFGITNPLANPKVTLVRSSDQAVIATNDDWQADAQSSDLSAAGFAPTNALEAGLIRSLAPGAYTAIVEGVGGGTGIAVVGVYEVSAPETPLANLSTRGLVLTGDDVMIGGFVIEGTTPQTVAIVATGPSLTLFGISSPLANPSIRVVRSSDQVVVASNDDWGTDAQQAQLAAAGFAPANTLEAGLYRSLPPGAYTVIVEGVGGGTGVAVIGVYRVN
jgi:hypothetical protein